MVALTSTATTPMSFAAAAAAPPPSTTSTTGSMLHTPFVFSYMRRGGGNKKITVAASVAAPSNDSSVDDATKASDAAAPETSKTANGTIQPTAIYETSIRVIRQIHTIEEFWETYNFIKRPNELNSLSPPNVDYHFFRVLKNGATGKYIPIKPTWEDPNNTNGGKWIIRLPKGLGSRYWEEIILALIGQQFSIHGNLKNESEEICGAVISIRYNEDILGVWNRNASPSNHVEIEKIRVAIQKILQLPIQAHMEYKPHETSLQDRTTGSTNTTSLNVNNTNKATTATKGDASAGTTAASSTSTSSSAHHHHHHHHTTTSRRSGSWTERDKTNSTNNNIGSGPKQHHSKDNNAASRGSWRN